MLRTNRSKHYAKSSNNAKTKKAKTIPYFRLKQLENYTLKCGTYPYSLYIGVPPPPPPPRVRV